MPALALFQPEIPQNTGAILRSCACLGVDLHLIGPLGFIWNDRKLARAGLDYIDLAHVTHHQNWDAFSVFLKAGGWRLVLATTKASIRYEQTAFAAHDMILFGRESAGVPDHIHAQADIRIRIAMRPETRSLNVAISSAIILSEALRQLNTLPEDV